MEEIRECKISLKDKEYLIIRYDSNINHHKLSSIAEYLKEKLNDQVIFIPNALNINIGNKELVINKLKDLINILENK